MIKTKQELKEYLSEDNKWYNPLSLKEKLIEMVTSSTNRSIKKYLILLRNYEYHLNNAAKSRFHACLSWIYEGKKNRLGRKLSIEIGPNCFGKGLNIWHGGIVVNPAARIGENCTLHGGNCIGNNGQIDVNPQIGNNVDIGFGAVIIGNIMISDCIKIGANSVVNKSFLEEGITIAGVPAKKISS